MHEISTEIIQMNSHWETTGPAVAWICVGILFITIMASIIIVTVAEEGLSYFRRNLFLLTILLMTILGGAWMIFHGYRMPKQQVIKACANGPVSIEQLSVVYNIQKIDGKELTLVVK